MAYVRALLLSVIAACLAVLVSYVWVRVFNGRGSGLSSLSAVWAASLLSRCLPRFTFAPLGLALLLCGTNYDGRGLYTDLAARGPPAGRGHPLRG